MTDATPKTEQQAATEDTQSPVMELVDFRLFEGTDTAAFLRAAKDTETMLRARGTLTRRVLVRGEDGTWTDVVEWTSGAAATEAADAVMTSPACQRFMAMIDPESVSMRHAPILMRME